MSGECDICGEYGHVEGTCPHRRCVACGSSYGLLIYEICVACFQKKANEIKTRIECSSKSVEEALLEEFVVSEIRSENPSNKKLLEMLLAWQEWWQDYGSEWYVEGEFPQNEKPPFLKSGNPLFGEWIKDD